MAGIHFRSVANQINWGHSNLPTTGKILTIHDFLTSKHLDCHLFCVTGVFKRIYHRTALEHISDVELMKQPLHVFRREDADPAPAAPPPAQGVRTVQEVDDVTSPEVEVGGLRRGVVTEGVSQTRLLYEDTRCQNHRLCTRKRHVALLVLPPELVLGEKEENGCGRRGSTPERCFYKGWDRGYVQEGTREGLWGGPLSPLRCCAFCRSPPSGSRSRRTCPRCSTDHRPPGLWSAPPCRRSCKMTGPDKEWANQDKNFGYVRSAAPKPASASSSFLWLVFFVVRNSLRPVSVGQETTNISACAPLSHDERQCLGTWASSPKGTKIR